MKLSAKKLRDYKAKGQKIAAITAYDYSTAKVCDCAGADFILIGDSLAQVVLGYDSTVKIGMDEMKIFTSAVSRGVKNALVCADMPFLSYQTNLSDALKNAGELIKCGADAVKIEGGTKFIVDVIERLTQSGIAVIAHLGFTPQFMSTIGGHYVIGKNVDMACELLEQAKAVQRAGAYAIVLEMVPSECAKFISENVDVPTIGIGAGAACDGQILVSDDVLGKYEDFCPKFARKYADLHKICKNAVENYVKDVKDGNFPNDEESFFLTDEEKTKLENYKNN